MANGIGARVDDLKASLGRLSSRERVMIGSLAGVLVLGVLLGSWYFISSALDELREENRATQKALEDLAQHRERYQAFRKKTAGMESLLSRDPVKLVSYIGQKAKDLNIPVVEYSKMTPQQIGNYEQYGQKIQVRKVTIGQLASLLEALESSQTHIVQVVKLEVTSRFSDREKGTQDLDADLVVASYGRVDTQAGSKEGRTKTKRRRGGQ
jgi:hypothetical protein